MRSTRYFLTRRLALGCSRSSPRRGRGRAPFVGASLHPAPGTGAAGDCNSPGIEGRRTLHHSIAWCLGEPKRPPAVPARGAGGRGGRKYRMHAQCVCHVRVMCAASVRRARCMADLRRPRVHSRARGGESRGRGRALHTCARRSRVHSPCRRAISHGGGARRRGQSCSGFRSLIKPPGCRPAQKFVLAAGTNF